MEDNYKGYFLIIKSKITELIAQIEDITKLLNDPTKKKHGTIHLTIGTTTLHGIRFGLSAEERVDIVLSTDYGDAKSTMHLCDVKISNAHNLYYITSWLKYLRSYIN